MTTKFAFFLLFTLPLVLSHSSIARLPRNRFDYVQRGTNWPGTCSSGQNQSPIDIHPSFCPCNDSIQLELYVTEGPQSFPMYDNNVTFRGNTTAFSLYTIEEGTKKLTGYQSEQFDFHSPSDHKIDGEAFDLEMHIVYRVMDNFTEGNTANQATFSVVAILFEIDEDAEENPFIEALNFSSISTANKSITVDIKSTLFDTLPSPLTYYTYEGSLTVPPCSEGVNWYVIDTPLKIKRNQLEGITKRFAGNNTFANGKGNNRKAQDLNGRIVSRGGYKCEDRMLLDTFSSEGMMGTVLGSFVLGMAIIIGGFCLRRKINHNKRNITHRDINHRRMVIVPDSLNEAFIR